MSWIPENIPDGWKVTRIGEVTDVIRGGSPRPKGDPRYFGGNIPWIMIADVSKSPGKYISKTRDTVTEAGARKSRYLKKGTLILSNSGTVCVPKVLAVDGCIHDGFVAFPDLPDELNIFYLYDFFYYIRPKIIDKHKQGVTQVNLNLDIVRNIELLLPPLNEQKRIVTKIEALQTRSTAVKEELEAIKPLLNQFRQSVLASAFRGDLTKDWREQNLDVESAEVLLERIRIERRQRWEKAELEKMKAKGKVPKDDKWKKKYKEPELIDTDGLPELSDGWCWVNIEKIGDISGGLTKNSKRKDLPLEFPYLRVANVYANQLKLNEIKTIRIKQEEYERVILKAHDLLIVEGNGSIEQVGRVALWNDSVTPCLHQNHLIKVRFNPIQIAKYALWWLLSDDGRRQITLVASSTSGLHTLSLSKVSALPIPFAPLEEQKEIVRRIESLFKLADNIEQQYQQAEIDLETLNQSILAKAFRGELVPQDPSDEPASVLLERIKEERDKAKATAKKSKTKKKSSKKKDEQLGIPGM